MKANILYSYIENRRLKPVEIDLRRWEGITENNGGGKSKIHHSHM
jgi:hypothetical protein